MKLFVAFFLGVLLAQPCFGWFENGHHLIAVMAYETLTPEQRIALRDALKSHPRYSEDFIPPSELTDDTEIEHWIVGRASYWPDIARKSKFDRPTWHYELGSTLKIGDPQGIPSRPGAIPPDATLDSQNMYLSQAIEFCRHVWRDKSRPASERALAACWLGHLVGDSHQPCHSGSLYSETLFPSGDRGGNMVTTKQGNNLHLFWDSQLGSPFNADELNQRFRELVADTQLLAEAKSATESDQGLDPHIWINESSELGRQFVYSREILVPLTIADESKQSKPEMLELSEEYRAAAGQLAKRRASFAAQRLAKIWAEGL